MSGDENRQLPPEQSLDTENFLRYEATVRETAMIPATLRLIDRPGLRVCDVGGASGLFLGELLRGSPHPLEAVNLEVVESYRPLQADPAIRFLTASILDGSIPDDSFDIVTMRHVLHHMVAGSVRGTRANQGRVLDEVFRITRPGGHVVLEEEVNNVRLFSRAVYHLSSLASRFEIRCRFFQAGKVVVSFMTQPEVAGAIAARRGRFGLEILEQDYVPWPMSWRWRLTVLMANVGNVFFVIRVNKPRP